MDQDINFNTNIPTGPFDSNEKDNLSSECQAKKKKNTQRRNASREQHYTY